MRTGMWVRRAAAGAAVAVAVPLLGACGDGSVEDQIAEVTRDARNLVTSGGDTRCGDFVAEDADDQRTITEEYLAERLGSDREVPPAEVDAAVAVIVVFCAIDGNDERTIREADLTQPAG